MIPESYLLKWQVKAPWKSLFMVEQDLIISRALVELYNQPKVRSSLAFRGGTALNKLYINPPSRYSEDIDFVQITAEPIGDTIDAIREVLDKWLGKPKRKLTERSVKIIYKYETISKSIAKLKIEINTVEHYYSNKLKKVEYSVNSKWFKGKTL
jgi:predicted nucleotidyltransferase component of viral defense system